MNKLVGTNIFFKNEKYKVIAKNIEGDNYKCTHRSDKFFIKYIFLPEKVILIKRKRYILDYFFFVFSSIWCSLFPYRTKKKKN